MREDLREPLLFLFQFSEEPPGDRLLSLKVALLSDRLLPKVSWCLSSCNSLLSLSYLVMSFTMFSWLMFCFIYKSISVSSIMPVRSSSESFSRFLCGVGVAFSTFSVMDLSTTFPYPSACLTNTEKSVKMKQPLYIYLTFLDLIFALYI